MKKRGRSRSGGSRSQRNRRNRNRQPQTQTNPADFWGDPSKLPSLPTNVRMAAAPSAVPKSLGPPPLPGHEQIAEHYFAAIYDRAVTTAGALAAAGGLIDPDVLAEELGQ